MAREDDGVCAARERCRSQFGQVGEVPSLVVSDGGLMNRNTSRLVLSAALLVALTGAGCSDDGPVTSAPPATSAATNRSDDLDGYCNATLVLDQAFGLLDEPDTEALADLRPLVDEVVSLAPGMLADEATIFAEAFDEVLRTGDFAAMETPEMVAADEAAHAFDVAECGFETVDVVAADFSFDAELPTGSGRYSLEIVNEGEEIHLAEVARLRAGETGTAEEVFAEVGRAADPEAAFGERFERVSGLFLAPGDRDYLLLDLTPGQYILFCPIPIGSTAGNEVEGDGPPHFVQGMVEFIDVT